MNHNRTTFVWMDPQDSDKKRPKSGGWDILTVMFEDGNISQHATKLPNVSSSSGKSIEELAELIKGEVWRFNADYVILEGCRATVILSILEDPMFIDRVLLTTRNKSGQVTGFNVVLPELATKPFRRK